MALKNEFLKTQRPLESNPNADIIRYDADFDYLINAGVPLDTQSEINKETLLHIAVWTGQVRSVKKLISLGAKVDIQDSFGNTALHLAVIKQDIEMITLLIKANRINTNNIKIKNENDFTGLKIVRKKGYQEIAFIISLLLASFKFKDISNANKELYGEFINKLEKLDYVLFVRNSLNNEFKKSIENLTKLEKEIENLAIERKKLAIARKNKKWLNIITFGFYKKKITKKLMNNFDVNFKKVTQLLTERDKLKNHIQEIEKMIDKEKKLRIENEVLEIAQQVLQKESQDKTEALQVINETCTMLTKANNDNDKKIAKLNHSVQKLNNNIADLRAENAEYKKIQTRHNEDTPVFVQNLYKTIEGLHSEVKFYKQYSDDSGVDITEEFSNFMQVT